jgi:hypothetical protein
MSSYTTHFSLPLKTNKQTNKQYFIFYYHSSAIKQALHRKVPIGFTAGVLYSFDQPTSHLLAVQRNKLHLLVPEFKL